MTITVWVCGRALNKDESWAGWALEGIFTEEAKAVEMCEDNSYFVGPVELNKPLNPGELIKWPGSYYPITISEK